MPPPPPVQPTAELATETLTAILLAGASSDPNGVLHDLVALVARYHCHHSTAADRVIAATKSAVGSNRAALDLLAKMDRLSRGPGDQPFGPISDNDPAAVDRLSLHTRIAFLADAFIPDFTKGIRDLVDTSQGTPPKTIKVAASRQERLGRTTLDAFRRRDASLRVAIALVGTVYSKVDADRARYPPATCRPPRARLATG